MKYLLYILIAIGSLHSCASTRYYAYEGDGGYYTFEVNRKWVIYRFSDNLYLKKINNYYAIPYGYVWGGREKKMEKKYDCLIYFKPNQMLTLWNLPFFDITSDEANIAYTYGHDFAIYRMSDDNKELRLVPLDIYNESGALRFGETGDLAIEWLPPKLKRVKRIDYSKFVDDLFYGFDMANPQH